MRDCVPLIDSRSQGVHPLHYNCCMRKLLPVHELQKTSAVIRKEQESCKPVLCSPGGAPLTNMDFISLGWSGYSQGWCESTYAHDPGWFGILKLTFVYRGGSASLLDKRFFLLVTFVVPCILHCCMQFQADPQILSTFTHIFASLVLMIRHS